jgi:pimeloyl-ACP methyl ester carboxylesterase
MALAMETTSSYQSVEGVRIHCRSAGSGPTLLLVHGYLVSQRSWEAVLPALAERFTVIAFDLPGHGESDRPASFPYTLDAFAHTTIGLLDALGIARARLCGHSFGGSVALAAAARAPERIERLVGVCPITYAIRFPLEGRLALLPVVGEHLFKRLYSRRDLRRYFRGSVYLDPALPTEEALDFYWERLNRPGGRDASYRTLQTLAHVEPAIESSPRRVRCPVRLVWGAQDRIVPRADAERLRAALPTPPELAVVEGSGHAPQEERPEAFLAAVLPFLTAP